MIMESGDIRKISTPNRERITDVDGLMQELELSPVDRVLMPGKKTQYGWYVIYREENVS
jgi:hypothetical protein